MMCTIWWIFHRVHLSGNKDSITITVSHTPNLGIIEQGMSGNYIDAVEHLDEVPHMRFV